MSNINKSYMIFPSKRQFFANCKFWYCKIWTCVVLVCVCVCVHSFPSLCCLVPGFGWPQRGPSVHGYVMDTQTAFRTTHTVVHKARIKISNALCIYCIYFILSLVLSVFLSQCLSWSSKGKLSLFYSNDCGNGMSFIPLVMIANWVCVCAPSCVSELWWKCRQINPSVRTRLAFTSRICSGESSIVSLQNILLSFPRVCDCIVERC